MIRAEGCVKDSLLDPLQICKLQGDMHINRDELVTWRQHAHVLSHTASKAKFVDYLLMRNERNDPILQQQRKVQEQAVKTIQRAAAALERTELALRAKAIKILDKAVEKERRGGLSAAERKSEDDNKKVDVARRKASKTLEAEDRLRVAIEVAAGAVALLPNVAGSG